jgi:hypothetical protein
MAATVLMVVHGLHSWLAVVAGIGAGIVVFVLGLRLASVLAAEDRERLLSLERRLPLRIQTFFRPIVMFIAPQAEKATSFRES